MMNMNEHCVTVMSTVDKVFLSVLLFFLFSMLLTIFFGISGFMRYQFEKCVDGIITITSSITITLIFVWVIYHIWG